MIDDYGHRVNDGKGEWQHSLVVTDEFRADYYALRFISLALGSLGLIVAIRLYGYAWTISTFIGCSIPSAFITWRQFRKDRA
jgi:hypothetical protein